MKWKNLKEYAPAFIRVPLGLVFLFFAMEKLRFPQGTIVQITSSPLPQLFPLTNTVIYSIAGLEFIVAACFIFGFYTKKAAVLAILLLLPILIIAKIPQDIALLGAAISLWITG